jgi:hypothetical protein
LRHAPDSIAEYRAPAQGNAHPRTGTLHALQGLFTGTTVSLQAQPSGGASAYQDFGQRSAVDVVAGGTMKRMWLLLALLPLAMFATDAKADDELPSELLLRCELKTTINIVSNGKTDFHEATKVEDFHLKDGTIEFTSALVPLGTDCKLSNGTIGCKFSQTKASSSAQFGPSVKKTRERCSVAQSYRRDEDANKNVTLSRRKIKGEPSLTMNSHSEGICRSVGKPLF